LSGWDRVDLGSGGRNAVEIFEMRKFFGAVAAMVMAASTVGATEPVSLDGVGLGGIEQISDAEGKSVRGLSASSAASGLSSLGAIFYDVTTGSKANIDLVNFSAGEESDAAPGAGVDAQNYNAIGIAGDLAVTFPGDTTAGVSAFSAGGSSQGGANLGVAAFVVPNPAANPFFNP
jgi:hypothetical protein